MMHKAGIKEVLSVHQSHPLNIKVTRAEKSTILSRIERFPTVTPLWIHRWLGNDAQSLKWHRRKRCPIVLQAHQSNFKVTRDEKSTIWLWFPDDNSNLNSRLAMKWHTELLWAWKRFPTVFRCHPSNFDITQPAKIEDLDLCWAKLQGRSQLSNPSDLPCLCSERY